MNLIHGSFLNSDQRKKISKIHSISFGAKNKKTEFPFIVLIKKSGKYAGSTRFTILI
jgi:hypothetical protein